MANKLNERELSYEILLRVIKKNEFLNAAIKEVFSTANVDSAMRAAVLRLVNGSVEKMTELDFYIDVFSSTPVRKQKKEVHVLLLLGVYQLKYMDSIPSHAAINETVKLACAHHFASLRGFINAVLRSIDRALFDDSSSDFTKLSNKLDSLGELERLSIDFAMPLWIVQHFASSYKSNFNLILEGLSAERGTVIRVNESRISPDDYEQRLSCYKLACDKASDRDVFFYDRIRDNAFLLKGVTGIDNLPGFDEGEFYVQDLSAMETVEAAMLSEKIDITLSNDTRAVDVCAAPGGKSLYASVLMGGKGEIIARDLTQSKTDLIDENIFRLGAPNVRSQVWDATVLDNSLVGKCDLVIADLPCSGLGVINKKPDIRHRVCEKDLTELSLLQREILLAVVPYVKTGGVLLYSTCTLDPLENEKNAKWILSQWPNLTLVSERTIIPDELHDGFYYACYKR